MRETFCAAAMGRSLPSLPAPVHVFGGATERSFHVDGLTAWRAFAPLASDGEPAFSCTLLPGGHFYLDEPSGRDALLGHVSAHLVAALQALPPSILVGPPLPSPPDDLPYVHEMVETCAAATPDAVALVDTNSSRTYRQLVDEASLLGAWLVMHGARPATAVAVLMHHCAE